MGYDVSNVLRSNVVMLVYTRPGGRAVFAGGEGRSGQRVRMGGASAQRGAGETAAADQSAAADGSSLAGPRANCPDVPGLCIRLNPVAGNLDEYEALFVCGPLQGFRLTSKVSTMSQEKWDRLQATAESWQCPAPDINSPVVERHHKVSAVIQLLQQTMATKLLAQEQGK